MVSLLYFESGRYAEERAPQVEWWTGLLFVHWIIARIGALQSTEAR